jgi:hypothetical protein
MKTDLDPKTRAFLARASLSPNAEAKARVRERVMTTALATAAATVATTAGTTSVAAAKIGTTIFGVSAIKLVVLGLLATAGVASVVIGPKLVVRPPMGPIATAPQKATLSQVISVHNALTFPSAEPLQKERLHEPESSAPDAIAVPKQGLIPEGRLNATHAPEPSQFARQSSNPHAEKALVVKQLRRQVDVPEESRPPLAHAPSTEASSVETKSATKSSESNGIRVADVKIAPISTRAGVTTTLADEADLIRKAAAAIAKGDDIAARALLAEHQLRFPKGFLQEERAAQGALLRCRAAKPEEARAVHLRFAAAFPHSIHEPKVERACTKR